MNEISAWWGKSIKISTLTPSTLSTIFDWIRNTSSPLKSSVDQVRAISDLAQRQDAKKALLPYFVLNKFKKDYRNNKNFEEARFFVADFDHLSPSKLLEVTEKLKTDLRVYAFFLSPSSDGVKIILPLATPILDGDVERFSSLYSSHIKAISEEYGVTPDFSCKDPARAIFFSHDENLFVREKLEDCTGLEVAKEEKEKQKTKKQTYNLNPEELDTVGQKIIDMFSPAAPGARTHQLTQIIGLLQKKGFDENATLVFVKLWNEKNTPPHPEKKLVDTIHDMYSRYGGAKTRAPLPFDIIEKNNQYVRFLSDDATGGTREKLLTSFIIEPDELLVDDEGDRLKCSVVSSRGVRYENILLESNDWTAEALHNAISHMDCTILATDHEIKVLKMYIDMKTGPRKTGTRVIGMQGTNHDVWVVKNCNITKDKVMMGADMAYIPYDRGGDAFYNKIEYDLTQDDATYKKNVAKFYELILKINTPTAVLPILGWNFASPLRAPLMKLTGKYPILFIPGSQGSGKTSTVQMFLKLHGFKDTAVTQADIRKFPLLKMLSSTNGIPVYLDEFKEGDMTDYNIHDIHRFIRKSTDGGVEPKGHADQTTTDYKLLAPWSLIGEWTINVPAERERMIMPRFSADAKWDPSLQACYKELDKVNLSGFMPRYIKFLLGKDVQQLYNDAYTQVSAHFASVKVVPAPRILHNLTIMTLGLNLFDEFGKLLQIPVPVYDLGTILTNQLTEITGTSTGQVVSALDQLVGALSQLAAKERRELSNVNKEPWYALTEHQGTRVLAIRMILALPLIKEWAGKRGRPEFDLLDAAGYKRMMNNKENAYVISSSHPIRVGGKQYRCLILDVDIMKRMGIDLEGFEDA